LETLSTTKGFSFSVEEAMKTGFYISGTPGSGKSDVAMRCADRLREAGVTVMVWDPSQDWLERYKPITYQVKFMNPPYSFDKLQLKDVIFDTSTLTVLQMQEVIDHFCWLLYTFQAKKLKEDRKPFFLLFEEAQIVAPQGAMRAKRLQNVMRVITVGRNYKIRVGLVTQFASTVDKDCVKSTKQRYFGWTDEMNDVSYIGKIVGEDQAKSLRYYKAGEFLYNFPAQNVLDKIYNEPYA
jgi:hypothetical protein